MGYTAAGPDDGTVPVDSTLNIYDSEDARGTIAPLPPVLTHGLGAVAVFGFASFLSTVTLFVYLSYKLVCWQLQPSRRPAANAANAAKTPLAASAPGSPVTSDVNGFLVPPAHVGPPASRSAPPPLDDGFWQRLHKAPPNQFLVLVYNLLLADIQQATAFLLNVQWLARNAVAVGTPVCWVQGWFVSTGDLASSVFIAAIAAHTYLGVVRGCRPSSRVFYAALAGLWAFVYVMALLGVIITGNGAGRGGLYVRAGAWCWINSAFQDLRLYLHYLWIFLALALTSVIYVSIFAHLHQHSRHAETCCLAQSHGEHYPNPDPNATAAAAPTPASMSTSTSTSTPAPASPRSVTTAMTSRTNKRLPPIPRAARHPTFLLYPLVYVLCTAPLAAGRIASMAGHDVSLAYFCFAGAMIASAGWLDVALYSSTRRAIVFAGAAPPGPDTGLETFAFMRTPAGRRFGNVVYVAGGDGPGNRCHERKRWRRWNGQVLAGARLPLSGLSGLRSGRRGGGSAADNKNAGRPSLKGFGAGAGEIMGMAIQCDTVTSVTVEEAKASDAASVGSRHGTVAARSSE